MPAAARAPQNNEAFVLDCYMNSSTTDHLDTPVAAPGLYVPNGWGPGYRAWNRGWRLCNPNAGNAYFNPGVRHLRLNATNPGNNSYAAAGNPFTINIWDLQPSSVTNAIVQVAASYVDASQATHYINPPFSNYCWGLYNSNNLLTFPTLGNLQECVQLPQPSGSLPVGIQPNQGQPLYVGALATLVFADPITFPSSVVSMHVSIAVYLALTANSPNSPTLQCFDDPDMDVGAGTNR